MPARTTFYSAPHFYEIAFDQNRKAETDFLEACFKRYARRPVRRLLDVACGTGSHLFRLAQRGYQVAGLDLSKENLDYVRQKAANRSLSVELIHADMARFRVPRPFDAVICMQDSQGHLLTSEAILDHLKAVARALRPGGLYIFDRMIPNSWANPAWRWAWTKRRGGLTIRTTFTTLRNANLVSQVCREEILFEIQENGTRSLLRQHHLTRVVFPQELRALVAQVPAFELVQWFSNFDVKKLLDRSRRPIMMIPVLRKKR
ncbi:MAG TPA: class I SAM-dependent methyltransferase [Methylomirabilota bacterium]|nr:class I SAM-dependent methyltransferase [Methylomirabilota bacterium]